jgi:hypothetical protein
MDKEQKTGWYTKRGLWSLFLVSAFPIHLWAIILILNDFAWVADRTDVWDAIGVGAYGLLYAFIESVIVFLMVVLVGFLLPKSWQEGKKIALLSVLYLVTALWAIAGQLYFLLEMQPSLGLVQFLIESGHPLRIMYGSALPIIGLTVALPTLWVITSERSVQVVQAVTERFSLLTIFYLFFDLVALVIVIVRNLKTA